MVERVLVVDVIELDEPDDEDEVGVMVEVLLDIDEVVEVEVLDVVVLHHILTDETDVKELFL